MGADIWERASPEMLSVAVENVQPVCIDNHTTHSRIVV